MNKFLVESLISLKNAAIFRKEFVSLNYSKQSLQIVHSLYLSGYIQSYKVKNAKIFILMRFFFNKPVLKDLKIISTPSNIRCLNLKQISKLSLNRSTLFMSTSKGILTAFDCKRLKIGGTALFVC
jgi:small subunit ribosomal protein S8